MKWFGLDAKEIAKQVADEIRPSVDELKEQAYRRGYADGYKAAMHGSIKEKDDTGRILHPNNKWKNAQQGLPIKPKPPKGRYITEGEDPRK